MRRKTVIKISWIVSVSITLAVAFVMFQKGKSPFQIFSTSVLVLTFCLTTGMRFIAGTEHSDSDMDALQPRTFIVRVIIMYLVTPILIGVTFLIVPLHLAWGVAMLIIACGLALSAIVERSRRVNRQVK
jgi:hypothetical protein